VKKLILCYLFVLPNFLFANFQSTQPHFIIGMTCICIALLFFFKPTFSGATREWDALYYPHSSTAIYCVKKCHQFSESKFWCHLGLNGLTDLLRCEEYNRMQTVLDIKNIAQEVSRWVPHAAAHLRAWVRSCGIYSGQSGTGEVFFLVLGDSL
jgi:hypothetical protein